MQWRRLCSETRIDVRAVLSDEHPSNAKVPFLTRLMESGMAMLIHAINICAPEKHVLNPVDLSLLCSRNELVIDLLRLFAR